MKIPKGWKELTPGDVIRADDKILAWGGLKFVRCGLKFVRGGLKFVRCGKAKTPSFSPPVGERYLHDYPHHLTIRKFKNIKMKSTLIAPPAQAPKAETFPALYLDTTDGDVYLVPVSDRAVVICSNIHNRIGATIDRGLVLLSDDIKRLEGPQTIQFTP